MIYLLFFPGFLSVVFLQKTKQKKERQRLSNVCSFQIQTFQKIFLSDSLNLALFSCATQNPKLKFISPPNMKVYLTIQNPNWKFTLQSKIKIYPTNQNEIISPPKKESLSYHQKSLLNIYLTTTQKLISPPKVLLYQPKWKFIPPPKNESLSHYHNSKTTLFLTTQLKIKVYLSTQHPK